MLQKEFNPILRFMVVSDVHYKDEHCVEEERMEKAIKIAYKLAEEHPTYNKLDAVFADGDFANSGTETQMRKFKATMDNNLKPETQYMLNMASHEYHGNGVETLYAHMLDNSLMVSAGDYVQKGQTIGRVCNTGYSFGAHLHFEVRLNGNRLNPAPYLGLE